MGPEAGPSTPRVRNTIKHGHSMVSPVNAQVPVTPPCTPGPSTHRTTVEEVRDEDEFQLPKTPVPNRKLMHPALFPASPVIEEISATPTKSNSLRNQASIPLGLSNPFEAAPQSKVTNNIVPSQFLSTQPTTFALPGSTTQPAFQKNPVAQQPLPQFAGINIQPTIRDQYIAEQPQPQIHNDDVQPVHQPRQTDGLHVSFPNAPQSGRPLGVLFDGTAQPASQGAQWPQFSFPDLTNRLATSHQPQTLPHKHPTAPIFQQPQPQFSFPPQAFQPQQQTFSSMSMNSIFQVSTPYYY